MKTKLDDLMAALQAAAAVCTIGAVKLWAPVCGSMLELANGNETHMKCYYAGQAAFGVALIILAIAAAFLTKKGYKSLLAVNIVAAAVLFFVFSGSLIGVCVSETMRCQTTALWGRGAAVVVLLTSLIDLFAGKEGQLPS